MLVVLTAFLIAGAAFAQSEKYVKAMENLVPAVDTTRDAAGLTELANSFERIGDAEKTQWLPYYYAAYCHVNIGYSFSDGSFADKSSSMDPEANKAEELLNKAAGLTNDNSELWVIRKLIASLRMMGNPMARYMEFAPKAAEALEKAKQMNADNPRVYLLDGEDKFYTPEQYGGSKTEAKKLFEEAQKKFEVFKPESSIAPNWGMPAVKFHLSQLQ